MTLFALSLGQAGTTLTFAKISGPDWLGVAANGTLAGTPGFADAGANQFTVGLTDSFGWSSTATIQVVVAINPVITLALIPQGNDLLLNWSGQQPAYQVQMTTNLAGGIWQNLGSPTTNTSRLMSPSNQAAFYRIHGQ